MVIRSLYIYLGPSKQNLEEITRHQAGLAEVFHALNTAALHVVQAVRK